MLEFVCLLITFALILHVILVFAMNDTNCALSELSVIEDAFYFILECIMCIELRSIYIILILVVRFQMYRVIVC